MDVLQMLDDIIYGGFTRGHAVDELAASGRAAIAELMAAAETPEVQDGCECFACKRLSAALAACRLSQEAASAATNPKSAE